MEKTGWRPSPPSDLGRRGLGRFFAASSATDIPPVPGSTVPSFPTGRSRVGLSTRTPSSRLERPIFGEVICILLHSPEHRSSGREYVLRGVSKRFFHQLN